MASTSTTPRFPHVTVQLSGEDGNAFFIIRRVRMALREGGATKEELDAFTNQATFADYDTVLQTVFEWVNVE